MESESYVTIELDQYSEENKEIKRVLNTNQIIINFDNKKAYIKFLCKFISYGLLIGVISSIGIFVLIIIITGHL